MCHAPEPTALVLGSHPGQWCGKTKEAKQVGIVKQSMHNWAHPARSYQVIEVKYIMHIFNLMMR